MHDAHTSSAALEQAAHWKTLLTSGEVTASQHEAFQGWLQENVEHERAYQQVEQFWNSFENLDPLSAKSTLLEVPSRKKISIGLKVALSLFVAIAASWAWSESSIGEYYLADYRTVAGEIKEITLSDGSRITLNTGSALDVHYSNNQRLVKLRQGEIMIQVAKNPDRPFVVQTTAGTAQALGTQYTVKKDGDATSVAVIESRVNVCTARGYFAQTQVECVTLGPGDGVHEIKPGMQAERINVDAITAWTSGYLSFEAQPLSTVLDELERYTSGKIYYDAGSIADLRVSGVVPITDMGKAYAMLAKLLPVTIQRYPYLTIVKRTDAPEDEK